MIVTHSLSLSLSLPPSLSVCLSLSLSVCLSLSQAALAARRGALNLERWLQLRLVEHGSLFAVACVDYLRDNFTRMENKQGT